MYVTELKNLSSTCEFETINEGLILYKIVDGIRSSRVRDVLLRKGTDLTLEKAINICRTDETTRQQIKVMDSDVEIAGMISRKKKNSGSRISKSGPNQLDQVVVVEEAKLENASTVDDNMNHNNVQHIMS